MQKKTLFFVGGGLCLIVAIVAVFAYQQPRTKVAHKDADYIINATTLYVAFASNEEKANEQFVNKIVQVTGVIAEVQPGSQNSTILLSASNAPGGINCSMEQRGNKKLTTITEGKQITIKGRCTGFLMDVNLADAVLVTSN